MTDHVVQSATITMGNWLARRTAKGRTPTDDDLRREAAARWPSLTPDQIAAIVEACQKPRDNR